MHAAVQGELRWDNVHVGCMHILLCSSFAFKVISTVAYPDLVREVPSCMRSGQTAGLSSAKLHARPLHPRGVCRIQLWPRRSAL